MRPFRRSSESAPLNEGRSERARFTFAVAPGWRMLPTRQTMCGPSSTGSQRRSVDLGSAPETTTVASTCSPSFVRHADHPSVVRTDLGDVDAGAQVHPVAARGGRQRLRERAGATLGEDRGSGRSSVVTRRVVDEHRRGAGGPGAHRGVQHPARGERPTDRLVLEGLLHQVGHGHGQRADRLAPRLRAEVLEGLAELEAHDRVRERRGLGVRRRDHVDVREEAREGTDPLVEVQVRVGVGGAIAPQLLGRALGRPPERDATAVELGREHAHVGRDRLQPVGFRA